MSSSIYFKSGAQLLGIALVVSIFLTGCGSTLKSSWNNFRAYYNTYYNAEKSFKAGLTKVENQPLEINPRNPVRIHPSSVQAGNSDFQQAIDKGAQILRKFPTSKWVDDALLLIGKSYYYRQEFYPAIQKFEELRNVTDSPEMHQMAIIWKGRTQLDLKLYSQGVSYLGAELTEYPEGWSLGKKAEIQALLAEHHAMLENWQESEKILSRAIPNIEGKQMRGRAFFLYGQMLEQLGRYGEAYFAYAQVSKNFPGFEYTYWAGIKQADVARKEGNMDQAISIYSKLRRDDKNFERVDELTFEIARTLEMKGETEEAEQQYKGLLHQKRGAGSRSLRGDIYFRLGQIYSESYSNFNIAAAYFDSASTFGQKQEHPGDLDAQTLADAFGNYTRLKDTISRADSLLWLGSLPQAQLDSVLVNIRQKKRQALLAEQQSESQEELINRNISGNDDQATRSSIYGFLNHRNEDLVERGMAEFQFFWGDRPLMDNWRRLSAVQQSATEDNQPVPTPDDKNDAPLQNEVRIDLNIEAIPRTESDKRELYVEKENAQYELGNLFFLNLNMPDSARFYFNKVINNETDSEFRPRSMYSLYELYNAADNTDSLQYWDQRIREEYPDSKYARMIRSGNNSEIPEDSADSTDLQLRQQYQQIISSQTDNKPLQLRQLALTHRSSDIAPHIHYQAIEGYIRQARSSDSLAYKTVSDTLKKESGDSLADRSIENFKLNSANWDSVHMALQEFDTTFANTKQHSKVLQLQQFLEEIEESPDPEIPTCTELGISLLIDPGMDQFLSTVSFSDKLDNSSLSGEVTYSFVVTKKGEVESFRLISNRTSLGIEDAFEEAFENSLRFEAFEDPQIPEKIKCTLSFPIQQ